MTSNSKNRKTVQRSGQAQSRQAPGRLELNTAMSFEYEALEPTNIAAAAAAAKILALGEFKSTSFNMCLDGLDSIEIDEFYF